MKLTTRSMWLGLAAVVAGASVALPAAALAVTGQAGGTAAVASCKASSTQIWLGLGNGGGTLGTDFLPLEFSNIGHKTCSFLGYPGVSAVTAGGSQIGKPGMPSGPKPLVVLKPGQTAHAILGIVDAGVIGGCHMKSGAFLKVFAPGQKASQVIPGFTFTACTNKSVLVVQAVHAGVGIPGFTIH